MSATPPHKNTIGFVSRGDSRIPSFGAWTTYNTYSTHNSAPTSNHATCSHSGNQNRG